MNTRKNRSFFSSLNTVGWAAVVILLGVAIVGLIGPYLEPADPNGQDLALRLLPPGWLEGGAQGHILGTDSLGRDVFSRIISGARVSLLVGISATLVSGVIGTLVGIVSGYFGGRVDTVLMRVADVQLAFPILVLCLVLIAIVGSSLWVVIVILGVSGWMSYARVIRSEVLKLRSREFIVEARVLGGSDAHIMALHILPNIAAPLATIATMQIASMVVAESSLSYLGFGVPPEIPTWGGMLAEGQLYMGTAWWIAVFSGLALVATTLSINVLGDSLRDYSDPKGKR